VIVHDERTAQCRVYTFKEGLLSAVAHDLEIEVGRFRIERDAAGIRAVFDARSLRVLHATSDGRPRPDALSARDREKIEANIAGEVLETRRHPEVRFTASVEGEPSEVRGTLELHGRQREVAVAVRRQGERWIGEATLHQPDFGITPYSAMLGTLRIKPDVRVRIELPSE
jgi:hypothetical protein